MSSSTARPPSNPRSASPPIADETNIDARALGSIIDEAYRGAAIRPGHRHRRGDPDGRGAAARECRRHRQHRRPKAAAISSPPPPATTWRRCLPPTAPARREASHDRRAADPERRHRRRHHEARAVRERPRAVDGGAAHRRPADRGRGRAGHPAGPCGPPPCRAGGRATGRRRCRDARADDADRPPHGRAAVAGGDAAALARRGGAACS